MSAVEADRSPWQGALAAEHAAIAGYAVLGPRLPADEQVTARRDQQAHRVARDDLTAMLVSVRATPVPPMADYPLPFAVQDVSDGRRFAVLLEEATTAAYRYAVATWTAQDAPARRAFTVGALSASAVRAARWRRLVTPAVPSTPFPGI